MAGVLSTALPAGPPPAKRMRSKSCPLYTALLEELGAENGAANQTVYLGTISRVLPAARAATGLRDVGSVNKAELSTMLRDCVDDPVSTGGAPGRPRGEAGPRIDLLVVVQEFHSDGSVHFHFVMKLFKNMRFKQVKLTLMQRYKLPSHWSTHSRLDTAIRYVHVRCAKKPVVDAEPFVWTHDGREVDLIELTREPFMARAWRKRREAAEMNAAVEDKKAPAFNKLDFMALILSKHLHTKAFLLSYIQDHGSQAAQLFASKHQRRLVEYIEDAQEWADAKATAGLEKLSDWELLCQAADAPCKHGPGKCSYDSAVQEIFRRNAATLSPQKLAASLRRVIESGPSKTCRVPILVGPSNTGKSTLLYPFDDLFGPKHVFHKPALGSTFALRNLVKNKRFIFWDDYRPIEFAHEKTVPVATFLSLFIGKETEIQVSQSFNDGNLDVKWPRGVVFTAKAEGLWEPTGRVSAEDVRHVRNRVEEFKFSHVVSACRDVESCASCMARWIRRFSGEAAAAPALPPPPLPPPLLPTTATPCTTTGSGVDGFAGLVAAAKLNGPVVDALFADVLALGAVDVAELTPADWQQLPSWNGLRPLEARRLAAKLCAPVAGPHV